MIYDLALVVSFVTWIYILIASFKDGCLWPILILLFGPITILIYVLMAYSGNKVRVLALFYAPMLVTLLARLLSVG